MGAQHHGQRGAAADAGDLDGRSLLGPSATSDRSADRTGTGDQRRRRWDRTRRASSPASARSSAVVDGAAEGARHRVDRDQQRQVAAAGPQGGREVPNAPSTPSPNSAKNSRMPPPMATLARHRPALAGCCRAWGGVQYGRVERPDGREERGEGEQCGLGMTSRIQHGRRGAQAEPPPARSRMDTRAALSASGDSLDDGADDHIIGSGRVTSRGLVLVGSTSVTSRPGARRWACRRRRRRTRSASIRIVQCYGEGERDGEKVKKSPDMSVSLATHSASASLTITAPRSIRRATGASQRQPQSAGSRVEEAAAAP